MKGVYTVSGSTLTIIADAILAFINVDTDYGIEILRCWAGQTGTDTSEQLDIELLTQVSVFPTLITATPVANDLRSAVSKCVGGTAGAAGTCGINASANGAGVKTVVVPDSFNNLNGFLWVPTEKERIIIPAGSSSGFGMRVDGTPVSLAGWTFGVTFEER